MLEALLRALVEQGREASLVIYLLADLVFHAYALHREWIVIGRTALRDRKACETASAALVVANDKFVEQRILNERATGTIGALTERIRDLEIDLARAEGKQWPPQPQARTRKP